jgi:signal transduction histidine kinase
LARTRQTLLASSPFPLKEPALTISRDVLNSEGDILLHNAQTYAGEGSTVSVQLDFLPDQLRLVVADDGPGLSAELQKAGGGRIFDRFFCAGKNSTGLGLAIVREVARNHAGDVEILTAARGLKLQIDLFKVPRGQIG